MKLSDNARITLEKRYLRKNAEGVITETPEEMLKRVAGNLALVEKKCYGKSEEEVRKVEESFYEIMDRLEFLPNSPTLMNAGRDLQQLSACFVLPVEDSMESIFETDFEITNFNISITVSDSFMKKAAGMDPDPNYYLINPRTNKPHIDAQTGKLKQLNAQELFNLIVERAWKNGDPGLIYIDQMNRFNPTPHLGKFETCNPCGEVPLLPYEACCLGSINLGLFVDDEGIINWDSLREVVHCAVRFEDNVIDASQYVIPQIEKMHKDGNRKIGIGIMGWHNMLVKLGIPYDSEEALAAAEKVMGFINDDFQHRFYP